MLQGGYWLHEGLLHTSTLVGPSLLKQKVLTGTAYDGVLVQQVLLVDTRLMRCI